MNIEYFMENNQHSKSIINIKVFLRSSPKLILTLFMQKISISTGEKTIIQLPDLSTAGYSWEISGKFEDFISVEKMANEKTTRIKVVGGKKEISFEITGLQKGKATLQFQQKRSWEDKANKEKEYEITVV